MQNSCLAAFFGQGRLGREGKEDAEMSLLRFTSGFAELSGSEQSRPPSHSPQFHTEVVTFVCPSYRVLTSFLNAAPSFHSAVLQGPLFFPLILRRPLARKNKSRLDLGRFACLNGAATSARLPAANIKHQPYRFLAVIRPLPGDCITGSSSFMFSGLQTSVFSTFWVSHPVMPSLKITMITFKSKQDFNWLFPSNN